jgi:hypothetical protein
MKVCRWVSSTYFRSFPLENWGSTDPNNNKVFPGIIAVLKKLACLGDVFAILHPVMLNDDSFECRRRMLRQCSEWFDTKGIWIYFYLPAINVDIS